MPSMEPKTTPITMPSYNISEIFDLPSSMDMLNDEDFQSAMMLLDCPNFRKEDIGNSELNMVGRSDALNSHDFKSVFPSFRERPMAFGELDLPFGVNSCQPPDLNIQISGETSGIGDQEIKREDDASGCSPVIESFLREHWDDIICTGAKPAWPTFKPLSSCSNPLVLLVAPESAKLFLSDCISSPSGAFSYKEKVPILTPSQLLPSTIIRSVCSTPPFVAKLFSSSAKLKSTRRAKQCVSDGCIRRAQSNNRCKTHGGGARCQAEGCAKSSQGGGLCRAHGGGKKCRISGCPKGTQRLGLCYLHGGIRRCVMDGCKKKDRGSGYCISHGGGRRCATQNCCRSVRKRNHCQKHQILDADT